MLAGSTLSLEASWCVCPGMLGGCGTLTSTTRSMDINEVLALDLYKVEKVNVNVTYYKKGYFHHGEISLV